MNRNNVFTNSLLGATIQDDGKRERSVYGILKLLYFILILFYFYLFSLI